MRNHVEILPKIVSSDHTFRNERKRVIQDVLWYLVIFRFLEKKINLIFIQNLQLF